MLEHPSLIVSMSRERTKCQIGDVITLHSPELNGWLYSRDATSAQVLLDRLDPEVCTFPPNLLECRYQICAQRQYTSLQTLRRTEAQADERNRGRSRPTKAVRAARKAFETEQAYNRNEDLRVRGQELCYGQVVQLLHLAESKFLTHTEVVPAAAPLSMPEPRCGSGPRQTRHRQQSGGVGRRGMWWQLVADQICVQVPLRRRFRQIRCKQCVHAPKRSFF